MSKTHAIAPSSMPLSKPQLGIWLGQQQNNQAVYNTAEMLELTGQLDISSFKLAIKEALGEAEALHRHIIVEHEQPVQISITPTINIIDLDFSQDPNPNGCFDKWAAEDLKTEVDLSTSPLFLTALVKMGEDQWRWYLRAHHIALDGYGYSIIHKRLNAYYEYLIGKTPPPDPLPAFSQYLEEDYDYQRSDKLEKNRTFWTDYLFNSPAPISLGKAELSISNQIHRHTSSLSGQHFIELHHIANTIKVTWSDTLIAIFAGYLAANTRSTRVTLGLPVMNRLGSKSLRLPAMVMNIVPLQIEVQPNHSLQELAIDVAKQIRTTRPHHKYRYEDMRHDLAITDPNRSVFGPVINIMPFDHQYSFSELEIKHVNINAGPVADLSLAIYPDNDQQTIRINLDANSDRYHADHLSSHGQSLIALCTRWLNSSKATLAEILPELAPKSLKETLIVSKIDEKVTAIKSTEQCTNVSHTTVIEQIFQNSLRSPNKIAIEGEEGALCYAELWQLIQSYRAVLSSYGVGANSKIALCLSRGQQSIILLLAIQSLGACYIPLDIKAPKKRLQQLLTLAKPDLVLCNEVSWPLEKNDAFTLLHCDAHILTGSLPLEKMPTQFEVSMTQTAYTIFTSGTTGTPKGVVTSHKALAHFVEGARRSYGITERDKILQFAQLSFDASVEEIFTCLTAGATLVLRNETMLESFDKFCEFIADHEVTLIDLPTAYWHELTYSLSETDLVLPASVKHVIIGGEAALPERVARWQKLYPQLSLFNTYGPTETTVVATFASLHLESITESSAVPIGHPLAGYQALILNEYGYPVETGQEGELYITGAGLADGYFESPNQTAQRFVTIKLWHQAIRAYRTGDRVKQDMSGQILFLGRIDDEFKIGGHRVVPSEIENLLLAHRDISQTAVIGHELGQGIRRLTAHCVLNDSDLSTDAIDVKQYLSEYLPSMMIPTDILFTAELPLNSSGKIDKRHLARSYLDQQSQNNDAHSDTENQVINCWQQILGQGAIAPHHDFFQLGGQSLQAIQVTSRLATHFNIELQLADLFSHPTLSCLAELIDSRLKSKEFEEQEDQVEMIW